VAQTARGLDCAFVRGDGDVAQMAATEKMSIEAAARKARYLFLFAEAERLEAQAVVTAHTADDQVETLLMHLIHGSGLNGLRGMQPRTLLNPYSSKIPLVRPLLDTWREELEVYCREKQLQPRVDVTNADPTYLRNRIRLELIPLLAGYNPRIKERLTGLAANVRGSLEVLEDAISEKYRRIIEAYQIELEYGRTLDTYEGPIDVGGVVRTVEFVRLGRVALLYQTLDGAETGYWNTQEHKWVIDNDYAHAVSEARRVAKKSGAPDLLTIPVPAPQEVRS